MTQMQNFINGIMRIMLKAPVTCIGAVALIIFQMPALLPLMLVILVCAGLLIYGNMKLGYPRFDRMQRKLDGLNRTSREFLGAIRVVKAFRAEEQERDKFEDASRQLAQAGISSMRVMAVFGRQSLYFLIDGQPDLLAYQLGRPAGIGVAHHGSQGSQGGDAQHDQAIAQDQMQFLSLDASVHDIGHESRLVI